MFQDVFVIALTHVSCRLLYVWESVILSINHLMYLKRRELLISNVLKHFYYNYCQGNISANDLHWCSADHTQGLSTMDAWMWRCFCNSHLLCISVNHKCLLFDLISSGLLEHNICTNTGLPTVRKQCPSYYSFIFFKDKEEIVATSLQCLTACFDVMQSFQSSWRIWFKVPF